MKLLKLKKSEIKNLLNEVSVQFSPSTGSDSLQPHGLQHARPPCPSLTPGSCSNSCPLSRWCHPTTSSCHPFLLLPLISPSIRVFSNESALYLRWPKYWSFSFNISPSNEYSGLVGSPCSLRDSQESSPTPQLKASILWLSAFFLVQLSYPYMATGKKHSFDKTDLCWRSHISAF